MDYEKLTIKQGIGKNGKEYNMLIVPVELKEFNLYASAFVYGKALQELIDNGVKVEKVKPKK